MSDHAADIIVVGAGIFGATGALELAQRGHSVLLIDEGPVPHPLAASTDISKVVRMAYGADEQYMAMAEAAVKGFRRWNKEFGEELFHETGVTMFCRKEMAPGGFEYESYQTLIRRGHEPERLDADDIVSRFPAWKPGSYVDGFFHEEGGWAESGKCVTRVTEKVQSEGVRLVDDVVTEIIIKNHHATGVRCESGATLSSSKVVVAAGSWTQVLVPELASQMKATGHPVFHLKPDNPDLFSSPQFETFTADVSTAGWYGFPHHPLEGVVKIANHGIGVNVHPRIDERLVTEEDESALRDFLSSAFPALVDAPIVFTRLCLYSDTLDEHLWIDEHPDVGGLFVAAGGSGHGFKFGPILGELIADAVESKENEWLERFRWRSLPPGTPGEEASRYHG